MCEIIVLTDSDVVRSTSYSKDVYERERRREKLGDGGGLQRDSLV